MLRADDPTMLFSVETQDEHSDIHGVEVARKLYYLGDNDVYDRYVGFKTLHDCFVHGLESGARRPLVGRRRPRNNGVLGSYEWFTYADSYRIMKDIGSGLIAIGVKPRTYIMGISRNSSQWLLFYHGSVFYNIPHIFLQDSMSEVDVVNKIRMISGVTVVAVSIQAGELVLKNIKALPSIKKIIVFTEPWCRSAEPLLKKFGDQGIHAISFDDLVKLGRSKPAEIARTEEEDIAFVFFTSGTTAEPTGIKISHRNLMCAMYNSVYYSTKNFYVKMLKTDRIMSYLPMSHVIEILSHIAIIHSGGSIGFYSGEMDDFLKDISDIRPTFFVSVPRFFNMIYREISSAIVQKGSLKTTLFKKAYVSGLKLKTLERSIWRRTVEKVAFSRIRGILGGKVRVFVSGSSSIDSDVRKFFSVCFAAPFIETYGFTEACGAITMSLGVPETDGTVGPPCCCVLIKLANAQPLRTYAEPGANFKGEICVKGGMISDSYYAADPDGRQSHFDENGWFHTGDIGCWDEKGLLRIIDRKVNIITLENGMTILSESIEDAFNVSLLVDSYICYAKPGGPFAVGVAFLSNEALAYAASAKGMVFKSIAHALESEEFKTLIKSALDEFISKSGHVPNLISRYIHFDPRPLKSLDLLTASYKIKRHIARKLYKDIFDKFFEEHELLNKSSSYPMASSNVTSSYGDASHTQTDSATWV